MYLRNTKGFKWGHKRVYRIYKQLELNLRIKPRRGIKCDKPEALSVPLSINQTWSIDFMSDSLNTGRKIRTFKVIDDYNRVEKIKQTKASSISFFVTDYPFVKRYLEPLLPDTVKYNTFGLPSEYSIYNKNLSNIIKQNVWFNDKRIETILLGGSSDFGLSLPTD